MEIVSNNISAKVREVHIGKRTFIIRRSKVAVTAENVRVLQMLDILEKLDFYVDVNMDFGDVRERFAKYNDVNGITKDAVDQYIVEFPSSVLLKYDELRSEDVLMEK